MAQGSARPPALFKPFYEGVLGWLVGRTRREQGLLLAALVALVVYAGYSLIWQPLHAERGLLQDRIARLDHALTVLQALPVAAPVPKDPRPIATILTETAKDFDLTIRRIDASVHGADVSLEDAGFDGLIQWLDALEADHGLRLTTLDLSQRPTPGQVSATLTVVEVAR